MVFVVQVINILSQLITLLVILHIILSYFMSPYHAVRQAVDSIVEPLLAPIRSLMPQTGMLDFSPMILIILVQLVARLLIGLFIAS